MFQNLSNKQIKTIFISQLSILVLLICIIVLLVIFRPSKSTIFVTLFNADIISNDGHTILVDGFNSNQEGLRDTYEIVYSDDIKIVDKDGEDIQFSDLKKDGVVVIKFAKYKSLKDGDSLPLVLKIQYFQSREMLK